MAHMIDFTKGIAAFAHVGAKGWHGLGTQLQPGQTTEQWARAAGMDWQVLPAPIYYTPDGADAQKQFKGKVALYRGDTKGDLGVVSDGYQIVQPLETLEFFEHWAKLGAAHLETAGVLFEGRRWFAMARMGDPIEINPGDIMLPYLLMSTSADGSSATEGRDTYVRVVCANTLAAARSAPSVYRCPHRSKFNPKAARKALEASHEGFKTFCDNARELSRVKVTQRQAEAYTKRILGIQEDSRKAQEQPAAETFSSLLTGSVRSANIVNGAEQSVDKARRTSYAYESILRLFGGAAIGDNLPGVSGTAWGYLNAVTEFVDHEKRARNEENRFVSATSGPGDAMKQSALSMLLAA